MCVIDQCVHATVIVSGCFVAGLEDAWPDYIIFVYPWSFKVYVNYTAMNMVLLLHRIGRKTKGSGRVMGYMSFIKRAFGEFNKFNMKWSHV